MEEKYSFKGIKTALEDFQLVENAANIYLDLNTFTVFTSEHVLSKTTELVEVYQNGTEGFPTSQKELRDLCLAQVKANENMIAEFKEKLAFIEEYEAENPFEFKNLLKAVKAYNANAEGRILLNKETLEVSFVEKETTVEGSIVVIITKEVLTTFSHNTKITNAALKTRCIEKYLEL